MTLAAADTSGGPLLTSRLATTVEERVEPANTPKLSVTVLNYNYAHLLPECLDSILSQTYRDFEVILIDDRSTDNSLDVIAPYLADPRVRLVAHEVNQGYLKSLIEGTEEHSQGEYLSVISADDKAQRPDAFARQVEKLDANAGMSFCFSAYDRILVGEHSTEVQGHRSFEDDCVIECGDAFRGMVANRRMQVLHSGTMMRRASYEAMGGYRRDLTHSPDLALWLRLAIEGDVGYCEDALYGYRIHGSQMSGNTTGYRQMTLETFAVLDEMCAEAERRGIRIGGLKRAGKRGYLFGAALDEVFRGSEMVALKRCWVAVTMQPVTALTSRYFWIVLLRAMLGRRGYSFVRGVAVLALRPLRRGGSPATG